MEDTQLQEAQLKIGSNASSLGSQITSQLYTMVRILKERAQGTLPIPVPWSVTLLIPIALLYFLFPFDLIPDVIPIIGFAVWSAISAFVAVFQRWEKYEKRISELQQKNEEMQREIEKLQEDKCCCVCLESRVECVLKPCQHACACIDCAPLLKSCPLCRGNIKSWNKVYM